MNKENTHTDQFLKEIVGNKNPFKTPDNYFNNVSENISGKSILTSKETGFKTPEHYFNTFKVHKSTSKIRSLWPYLSAAAIIAIGFFVFKTNTLDIKPLNNDDIINYLALEKNIDIDEIINNIDNPNSLSLYSNLDEITPTVDELSLELSEFDIIDF